MSPPNVWSHSPFLWTIATCHYFGVFTAQSPPSLLSDNEGASHICTNCHYSHPLLLRLCRCHRKPCLQQPHSLSYPCTVQWLSHIMVCYWMWPLPQTQIITWGKHCILHSHKTSTHARGMHSSVSTHTHTHIHTFRSHITFRSWAKYAACQLSVVRLFWVLMHNAMQCQRLQSSSTLSLFRASAQWKGSVFCWCFYRARVLLGWACTTGMGIRAGPMGGLLTDARLLPSPSGPSISTPIPNGVMEICWSELFNALQSVWHNLISLCQGCR